MRLGAPRLGGAGSIPPRRQAHPWQARPSPPPASGAAPPGAPTWGHWAELGRSAPQVPALPARFPPPTNGERAGAAGREAHPQPAALRAPRSRSPLAMGPGPRLLLPLVLCAGLGALVPCVGASSARRRGPTVTAKVTGGGQQPLAPAAGWGGFGAWDLSVRAAAGGAGLGGGLPARSVWGAGPRPSPPPPPAVYTRLPDVWPDGTRPGPRAAPRTGGPFLREGAARALPLAWRGLGSEAGRMGAAGRRRARSRAAAAWPPAAVARPGKAQGPPPPRRCPGRRYLLCSSGWLCSV